MKTLEHTEQVTLMQWWVEAYNSAIQWAKDRIEEISNDTDFDPNQDFFACRYICGVSDDCIYDIEAYEERVWNR